MSRHWDEVQIREYREEDVAAFADYWFSEESRAIHEGVIDYAKVPPRDEWEKGSRKIVGLVPPRALVVVYREKAIGVHTLTIDPNGTADMHAHFWDVAARGQGIGLVSGVKAARAFLEAHGFERIFAKPPKANPYSSRFAKKLGLPHLGEAVIDYGLLLPGTIADVYEVHRDHLDELERRVRAGATNR